MSLELDGIEFRSRVAVAVAGIGYCDTRIGIAAPVNGQPIILSIGIGVKMAIIASITVNLIIV